MSSSESEQNLISFEGLFGLKIDRNISRTLQELRDEGYTTRQGVITGMTPEIGADIFHRVEVLGSDQLNLNPVVLHSSVTFFNPELGGGEEYDAIKEALDPQLLEAYLQETSRLLRLPLDKGRIHSIIVPNS